MLSTAVALRPATMVDAAPLVRLVREAIAHGCRHHYDARQREAVFHSYAHRLFVEMVEPWATVVAEQSGQMVGMGQMDLTNGHLRALFVAADAQGHGIGGQVLAHLQRGAVRRGAGRLFGTMSLNAAPFYARQGFRPIDGQRVLTLSGVPVPVVPMARPLS